MNHQVEEDLIRAKISYTTPTESVIDREVAIKLHATDARTQVYTQTLTTVNAEPTPKGLAKQLFQAVSQLHYDGEITILGIHGDVLGKVIEIAPEITGVVQKIHEDIKKNETRILFGPAKHLGLADMVELLRVNRRRKASYHASRRISGKHGSQNIEQATHTRIENSGFGQGSWGKMVLKAKSKEMILDAEDVKANTQVKLREEYVCENGIIKKRLVLASEPYEGENA